jgi:hypothetical protein
MEDDRVVAVAIVYARVVDVTPVVARPRPAVTVRAPLLPRTRYPARPVARPTFRRDGCCGVGEDEAPPCARVRVSTLLQ